MLWQLANGGNSVFFPLTFALNILVNTDSRKPFCLLLISLSQTRHINLQNNKDHTKKGLPSQNVFFRSIFKTIFPGLLSLMVEVLRRNVCCGVMRCSHTELPTPHETKRLIPFKLQSGGSLFFSLTPLHTSRTKSALGVTYCWCIRGNKKSFLSTTTITLHYTQNIKLTYTRQLRVNKPFISTSCMDHVFFRVEGKSAMVWRFFVSLLESLT